MEYKSDFIEREVQKITFFLIRLLAKISQDVNVSSVIQYFDEEFKEKLNFGFDEIFEFNEDDLKKKINRIDVLILENLLKVFYNIAKKEVLSLKFNDLKRVSLIILDEIENKSSVYSLERSGIKNYFKSV